MPPKQENEPDRGGPSAVDVNRPTVAFGPVMPGWGSWEWVGQDLLQETARRYRTTVFSAWEVPACDAAVVIKQAPPAEWLAALGRRTPALYCPVDFYGSAADIDADGGMLRRCARIVVHCERLRRYFAAYAPVEYLDHSVKFAAPLRESPRTHGSILWVGVRSNLPPLAEWVRAHPLPGKLRVLTNLEDPQAVPSAREFGFPPGKVRIESWSAEAHVRLLAEARGALDIKGDDFRARHKPPAKAVDFLASGVPLAMNPDSSPVEHLARLGFEIASPLEPERWLSREYWEETRRFGGALRELLSRERIGRRFRRLIEEVLAERRAFHDRRS